MAKDSIKAGARRASALVGLYSLSSGAMPEELNFALTEFSEVRHTLATTSNTKDTPFG